MKKLLSLVIIILLLCSCGGQKGEQKAEQKPSLASDYETTRRCGISSNLCMNGMLYSETFDGSDFALSRTYFFDFDSMKSALLCSKPNCKHDDYETCTAFGLSTAAAPVIIGKNLYFFSVETSWGGKGELLAQMHIMKADVDGSSRRKIATIDDALYVGTVFIKGDVIYFITQNQGYDPETRTYIDKRANSLYSFNFTTEECTNHGLIADGYSSHVDIVGEFNGKLYLNGSYLKEPYVEGEENEFSTYYGTFDLKTGEIGEWDMPLSTRNEEYDRLKPMFISGGIYGYMDGETSHIIDADGNELVLENYSISASIVDIPINGYYFNTSGGDNEKDAYTAVDLKTGEILKINKEAVPNWHYVLTYHDGNYIVYGLLGGNDFKKVSEDELFIRDEEK